MNYITSEWFDRRQRSV